MASRPDEWQAYSHLCVAAGEVEKALRIIREVDSRVRELSEGCTVRILMQIREELTAYEDGRD